MYVFFAVVNVIQRVRAHCALRRSVRFITSSNNHVMKSRGGTQNDTTIDDLFCALSDILSHMVGWPHSSTGLSVV